ncbi:DUF397 domain-containing protein [Streptomyces sp. FT05W]|nr:DUF397 domain-containing protein [Streptomyces sp. FT05W]PWS47652.1 DUF397 domain-containing protein [Streptomyces sp. FT05W]
MSLEEPEGVWRKSSGPDDNCVEVCLGPVVMVRDSKCPEGPRVHVGPPGWMAFIRFLDGPGNLPAALAEEVVR